MFNYLLSRIKWLNRKNKLEFYVILIIMYKKYIKQLNISFTYNIVSFKYKNISHSKNNTIFYLFWEKTKLISKIKKKHIYVIKYLKIWYIKKIY